MFQDCGRCGAGVQMRVKANFPIGFLCALTVKEGATPGASEIYLKKINALAVAAALKKKLKNNEGGSAGCATNNCTVTV